MAHSGGDLVVVQKEDGQNPFSYSLAGDGTSRTTHAVAGRTNFSIRVQKITIAVVTHANAKAIIFQDTASAKLWTFNDLTFAAGVPDVVSVDFGPHGFELATDVGLDIVEPGSGTVCSIKVEGYFKQKGTIVVGVTSSATATSAS